MLQEQISLSSDPGAISYADSRVLFGPFVLDPVEQTLYRSGAEVALPKRSFRLLEVLVRAAGQTVSKDQLVVEVWQGAYVSDTSLTEAMSRLRRVLGDEARRPLYIRTVHGRGYRFVATVRELSEEDGVDRAHSFRPGLWISMFVGLLAVFWTGTWIIGSVGTPPNLSASILGHNAAAVFDPLRRLTGDLHWTGTPVVGPVRPRYQLAQIGRNGEVISRFGIPALPLNDMSVDRAGKRLAFSMANGDQSDAWVLEPRKGELKRVATGGYFSDPVWAPNGEAVALAASRNGSVDLVLKEVDNDSSPRVLLDAPLDQFPESWSQDGRSLVYSERHPETGYDLWLLRQRSDDTWVPTPLVRTSVDEAFGAISPDGRYVAYASRSHQRPEIFVADLESDRAVVKVSRGGGAYPFWSATGDQLHFVRGDDLITVATVQLGDGNSTPRIATEVPGLYLAGSTQSADRIVVATLE